ncbi:MAG: hypothetical protein KDB01_19430 [Planctomycetaceae bacterium]|nr:hypothetical protein [Planctomycetaceae bacterium]
MNKFMQVFLDQVSERITAVIARLVATHIEVKCAEHQADVQCRVDELVAQYETAGQPEIAAHLRTLGQKLVGDSIVPTGEALLTRIQQMTIVSPSGETSVDPAGTRQRRNSSKRVLSLADETIQITDPVAAGIKGFQS